MVTNAARKVIVDWKTVFCSSCERLVGMYHKRCPHCNALFVGVRNNDDEE